MTPAPVSHILRVRLGPPCDHGAPIARRRVRLGAPLTAMIVALALAYTPPLDAQSGTMQQIRYGEIVSAEKGIVVDQPTGRGAQTGATVGAIAGYALADRGDRWIGSRGEQRTAVTAEGHRDVLLDPQAGHRDQRDQPRE